MSQTRIDLLVEAFMEHAKTTPNRKGETRGTQALRGFREGAQAFAAAVNESGLGLSELPVTFLHDRWLPKLAHRLAQPVQLSVRIQGVRSLLAWLNQRGERLPALYPVVLDRQSGTIRAVADAAEPPGDDEMSTPIFPGESNLEIDLPEMATIPAPTIPAARPAVPAAPAAPPPAATRPAATAAPVAMKAPPKNPLAALIPAAGYRLRVRREREYDEPVFVADYPADQVASHGALEPFLARVVGPRAGVSGDVTFLVSSVHPDGRTESERSRVTVTVVGVPSAVSPIAPTGGSAADLAELLDLQNRNRAEFESRLQTLLSAQQAPAIPAPAPAPVVIQQAAQDTATGQMLTELQRNLGMVTQQMVELSSVVAQMHQERMRPPEPPPPPPAPQLDMLQVMERMMSIQQKMNPTPAPAPVAASSSPLGGLAEALQVVQQAREVFQPQQVNVDVSPLEEQIKTLRAQIDAANGGKKGGIKGMLEEMRDMKELFSLFGAAGGPFGGARPAGGSLTDKLGDVIIDTIRNPEPVANAVERILGAANKAKDVAVTNELAKPPAKTPGADLEPATRQHVEALLRAESDAAIVTSAMELVQHLQGSGGGQKVLSDEITKRIKAGDEVGLVAFLRQVFVRLGYATQASPDRLQRVVSVIFAQIRRAQQQQARTQEPAPAPAPAPGAYADIEDDATATGEVLTVRVGGMVQPPAAPMYQQAQQLDEDDDDDGESYDDEDEALDQELAGDEEPVAVLRVPQATIAPEAVL